MVDYPDLVSETVIDFVDYRSSNVCNFKCRSCEPFYSNGIAQEAKKHIPLQQYYRNLPEGKIAPTSDLDKKWILDNIHQIKRLMFTGGEPTKIPEVREIVEEIRSIKNCDVNLMFTSNASFTDDYWFEITEKMKNIHWTLSLDAVGAPAEIIRHGTDWPVVSKNIETLFDISPSVNIGTVITNLSFFCIDDLFVYANELLRKYAHRPNGRTHLIALCEWPRYFSPFVWNEELLEKAKKYISQIESMQDLQPSQITAIHSLKHGLSQTQADLRNWQTFQEYNKQLDIIRQQDHTQIFQTGYQ